MKEKPKEEPAVAEFDVREHLARMWRYAEPAGQVGSAEPGGVNPDDAAASPATLPFARKPATGRRPRHQQNGGA